MDWINIKDKQPNPYQEVIIASTTGRVKSAIYLGNKWNTFLEVAYWMPFPTPPDGLAEDEPEQTPKKKRGRPKKV